VAFPVVVPAAATAILLSLPHCLNGSCIIRTCLFNAMPAQACMDVLTPGPGLAEVP
jgi:hypothetical protein